MRASIEFGKKYELPLSISYANWQSLIAVINPILKTFVHLVTLFWK